MSGGYIDPYGFSKGSGGGGSSGGGGGSKGYIDPYGFSNAPKGAKPQAQHHGGGGFFGKVGGFFSHIGSDAGSAIAGIPTGVEMLGKAAVHDSAKLSGAASHALHLSTSPSTERAGRGGYELPRIGGQIAHQYKQEYSPLLHGQFGKFGHEFYQHPLGPILDALTVATLGAGGVGKAGEIASDAGLISKESKLANLRVPTDLTTKGFDGENVVVKQSSHAPLVKYRQQLVNKALNKLPEETPVLGSTARAVRALSRGPAKEAARLDVQARDFNTAFNKLSKQEKVAWHLRARRLDPIEYRDFIAKNGGSSAMQKVLSDPKVKELVDSPSPRLSDALRRGEELSDHLTASRVAAGHLEERTAVEAPYRHLRMMSGATMEPVMAEAPSLTAAKAARDSLAAAHSKALTAEAKFHNSALTRAQQLGVPPASNPFRDSVVTLGQRLEAAQRNVDRLAGKTAQTGAVKLTGGKSAEDLMREIDASGGEHPFYVPDSAHVPGMRSRFASRPSGFSEPAMATKQTRLALARHGLINPYDNALGRDYAHYQNQAAAQLLHDELAKHAVLIGRHDPIPSKWEEFPLTRGQSRATYTQKVSADLEHHLGDQGLKQRIAGLGRLQQPRDIAGQLEESHRLIVPKQVSKILQDEARVGPAGTLAKLRSMPLSVWKAAVLGLRPAFFANITIGNSVLGTLQMAPGRWGFVGWLNQVMPGFEHVAGPALDEGTMKEVFPEQVSGTFGASVTPHGYHGPSRVLRGASRAAQGVMPATIRYENVLRRAMAEGWARATPEVQQILSRNGGDVNAALRQLAKSRPQAIDNISRRIDNALGNYRTYNKFERAIKSVVPFYGWNRHITSSLFRLASERPQTLDALLNTGLQGKAKADHIIAGISSYLNQSIPVHLPAALGGQKGSGIVTVLDPHSWNPFSTVTDEGKMLALPFNHAGVSSDAFPIAPDLQAFIEQLTGKSLLTGAPIKGNAIKDELENLVPQESLFTSKHPHSPNSVNQNHTWAQLLRILGLPVENVNMPAARQKWRTLNIPVK